jgi:3-oxoacyl-[acyl-carrier-protein] synthase-3
MRFTHVCIEAFGHVLPDRVVRSEELEDRLAPLYERLGLSVGRIELMSGIRERRFFASGTRPSSVAAEAGRIAIERSGIDAQNIGCLIHAAVCRDFLEPSTASVVHHTLGLPATCSAFDLSNACLGFANAMIVVANMIERGEIEAGLVVAGEDGGPLVESTLQSLLSNPNAGRRELKRAHASLTIGSGAAAVVLAHRSVSRTGNSLVGGTVLADTAQHALCQGDHRAGFDGPLMETDSEALLVAGNALAARTFEKFEHELRWDRAEIDRVVTHQVGSAHRRLLFSTLGLDPARDFPTVETLGNIGSVSLPLSFSRALDDGFIHDGDRVAMLGIGSGIHCLMLGVQW